MYIVKFVRKDELPEEDYYYLSAQDAIDHFLHFEEDDLDLYDEICLIRIAE